MTDTHTPDIRRLLLLAVPAAFAAGLLVMGLTAWALLASGTLILPPTDAPASASSRSAATEPAGKPASEAAQLTGEGPAGAATSSGAAASLSAADVAALDLSALPIALQNELDYLRDELMVGNERVQALEQALQQWTATGSAGSEAAGGAGGAGAGAADRPGGGDQAVAGGQSPDNGAGGDAAQREYDRLVAAGVDAQTANVIQDRIDQQELARLDLIDQASREGWRDSDEFDQQLAALDDTGVNLRSELGDDDYDRYLFESGRSNRVGIGSVINGSAADQAGLQAGDQLVGYADDRVFGLRELQGATRAGERGELVQVVVRRDGNELVVSVPRGPLGITLRPQRVEP